MTEKQNKFKPSFINNNKEKEIDVTIKYNDDRHDELLRLKAPKAKEILQIRKKLAMFIKDNHSGDLTKIDEVTTLGALEYITALCLGACVREYNGPDDKEVNELTDEQWLAFVYETGGAFSDMCIAAAKLCGFNDVAKASEGVQKQIDETLPEFDPGIDNPPV